MSIEPRLKLFDTTMAVVSLVIGIGIFLTPSIIAKDTQTTTLFFTVWITGGIITLLGALIFAEIGSRSPMAGGNYKLISTYYHPAYAFMLNWLGIILFSANLAAITIIGISYFVSIVNNEWMNSQIGIQWLSTALILLLFFINYIGIHIGARTISIITLIKIATIVIFSLVAFFYNHENTDTIQPAINTFSNDYSALSAFGLGIIGVFYAFAGYQQTMNMGADVINPKRNMPRGIIMGIVIIICLYLAINYGYIKILGIKGVADSKLIAADVAQIIFGNYGKQITSLIIFISVVGFLGATLVQQPRVYHAMAEDKVLPKIFKHINNKTQVQEVSLIFIAVTTIIYIWMMGHFEKALNYIMFNDALINATVASTIFILRWKDKEKKYTGYKMPLYPVLPIIFVGFLLFLAGNTFIKDMYAGLFCIAVLFIGYPMYYILQKTIR